MRCGQATRSVLWEALYRKSANRIGFPQFPQVLPDKKHFIALVNESTERPVSQRWVGVFRTSDFAAVKELFQTNSRVQYIASTVHPETGYLLYVRAGTLVARSFDPRTFEVSGEAMPV